MSSDLGSAAAGTPAYDTGTVLMSGRVLGWASATEVVGATPTAGRGQRVAGVVAGGLGGWLVAVIVLGAGRSVRRVLT